ncbi:hypothetical protein [Streptomyces canus]|nr:hypothetical protein [Streptomyces canus]
MGPDLESLYRRYLDERPTWSAEWNGAASDSERENVALHKYGFPFRV